MTADATQRLDMPEITKLSQLLRIAIDDATWAHQSDQYVLNMDWWHRSDEFGQPCEVCLAGSVLARRSSMSSHNDVVPDQVPRFSKAMYALDCLRCGDIEDALYTLDQDMSIPAGLVSKWDVPPLSDNPSSDEFAKWRDSLLKLANHLEEHGA